MVLAERVYATDLAKDMQVLQSATESLGRAFADLGGTSNKYWTILARLSSGSGLWRLQARVRSLSNMFELYYKAQDKSLMAQLDTIEANQKLAASFTSVEDKYKKFSGVLADLSQDDKDQDQVFQMWLSTLGSEAKAFEQTAKIYTKSMSMFTRAKEKNDKIMKKSLLPNMRERIEEGGMMKEILSPFTKLKETMFGAKGELPFGFEDAFGQHADNDERPGIKSQWAKMVEKIKSKKILENMGGFLKDSLAFLGKAMIWFALIVTGISIVAFILKKAWPSMKKNLKQTWKFWKKVGLGLFAIVMAIFTMIKMAFKGDIVGVIRTFFLKLLPAVISVLWNLVLALITTAVSIVGSLLEGIVKSIFAFIGGHWLGRLFGMEDKPTAIGKLNALNQGTRSGVPQYAHGGLHKGGLAIVGERGAELINLPAGARVHSNANSKAMMGNTININVSGHMGASDAELRILADKLSKEINSRMNRTAATTAGFR